LTRWSERTVFSKANLLTDFAAKTVLSDQRVKDVYLGRRAA